MFGIGFQEMIIILVVVLIIFGPKRLPDLAKSLGKGLAEFRKASDEVRKGIEEAVHEEGKPEPPVQDPHDGEISAKEAAAAEEPLSEPPPAGTDAGKSPDGEADAGTPPGRG
jgi:TatA/E family protein of Tat protein translocase